jgi:hypothetical protein
MNEDQDKPEKVPPRIGKQEEIFQLYISPARINGKEVKIGIKESRELHQKAICRGMTTESGELKSKLSWQETSGPRQPRFSAAAGRLKMRCA